MTNKTIYIANFSRSVKEYFLSLALRIITSIRNVIFSQGQGDQGATRSPVKSAANFRSAKVDSFRLPEGRGHRPSHKEARRSTQRLRTIAFRIGQRRLPAGRGHRPSQKARFSVLRERVLQHDGLIAARPDGNEDDGAAAQFFQAPHVVPRLLR